MNALSDYTEFFLQVPLNPMVKVLEDNTHRLMGNVYYQLYQGNLLYFKVVDTKCYVYLESFNCLVGTLKDLIKLEKLCKSLKADC